MSLRFNTYSKIPGVVRLDKGGQQTYLPWDARGVLKSGHTSEVLMSMPGPLEILVILFVILLLFGAKRLPEIGRALGEGIREFKKSMKDPGDDKPGRRDQS